MICEQCGEIIIGDVSYCKKCGYRVRKNVDITESPISKIKINDYNTTIKNNESIEERVCKYCGEILCGDVFYCKKCGHQVGCNNIQKIFDKRMEQDMQDKKICCPRCKSINLQYIETEDTNIVNTGKNFSGGLGCLGFLLMGPLGLLCGLCGGTQSVNVTQTKIAKWICKDCGNKFRDVDEINKSIITLEKNEKMGVHLCWIFPLLSVIWLLIIFPTLQADSYSIIDRFIDTIFKGLCICILACLIGGSIGAPVGLSNVKKMILELKKEKEYIKRNGYM